MEVATHLATIRSRVFVVLSSILFFVFFSFTFLLFCLFSFPVRENCSFFSSLANHRYFGVYPAQLDHVPSGLHPVDYSVLSAFVSVGCILDVDVIRHPDVKPSVSCNAFSVRS